MRKVVGINGSTNSINGSTSIKEGNTNGPYRL